MFSCVLTGVGRRLPPLMAASSSSQSGRVVLRPVIATMADYDEMLHWSLNSFTYCEPIQRGMGVTANDVLPYFEWALPLALESGISLKLLDEKGRFAAAMAGEMNAKVWELNPDAQKLIHHHNGFIVPSYQGRSDFSKTHISALIDYDKLKVLYKPDMSKYRMPDGSPIPMPEGVDAPLLIFRKL